MQKGEIAFSTIVIAIIALAMLLLILLWLFPSMGDLFKQTDDIKENAGIEATEIEKLSCDRYCALDNCETFTSEGCADKEGVSCEACTGG